MDKQPNLKGTKGTIEVHRWVGGAKELPATVLSHYQGSRRGYIEVQYDAVAPDTHAFTRNIAGKKEFFRINRRRRWVSLDRSPDPLRKNSPPHSNKFHPGEQRYTVLDIPF